MRATAYAFEHERRGAWHAGVLQNGFSKRTDRSSRLERRCINIKRDIYVQERPVFRASTSS